MLFVAYLQYWNDRSVPMLTMGRMEFLAWQLALSICDMLNRHKTFVIGLLSEISPDDTYVFEVARFHSIVSFLTLFATVRVCLFPVPSSRLSSISVIELCESDLF